MEVASRSQTQLVFPDLTKAQSAVQRVFAVLDRKSEIDPSAEGAAHPLDTEQSRCCVAALPAWSETCHQREVATCNLAPSHGSPRVRGGVLCIYNKVRLTLL